MPADPKDLLLADLEHFGESLWRNEELGEKRLTFFVTLVTAVSAGLTALAAIEDVAFAEVRAAAGIALLVLLVLGLVTYLRMLKRNRVTDQYKARLRVIRETYVRLCASDDAAALAGYGALPPQRGWTLPGGGYAETIGTINGVLLAALLIVGRGWHWPWAVGLGLALTVLLWVVARRSRG